ncbi:MAG: amidohydrolase family protein, partial [Candidatus Borkfalkia sp.]
MQKIYPRRFRIRSGRIHELSGVVNTDADVLKKLQAAIDAGKVIDGHAPSTGGRELNGYIAAAIRTDHECATPEEAREKVSKGMYVHLREGSATRNAALNSQAVDANNMRRFLFCTDDRHAADLVANGHLDNALRVAVRSGLDPVRAVTIATLNAA